MTRVTRLSLLLTVLAVGCTIPPTYTPERASAMIVDICRTDFKLDVNTQLIGQTMFAATRMPGFLRRLVEKGNLADQDSDNIGDLLMTTTQISLSADPPIQFYVLRLSDPEEPGTELRYITYLDDIRRLYASALSEGEFFERRIQDLKLRKDEPTMTDVWMTRGVTLGEFLAVQLAFRIKALAAQEPALAEWGVEDCVGWFRNGTFSWTIARRSATDHLLVEASWPPKVLELIALVLHEYEFTDYQRVIFTDASANTTHELTPAALSAYYKPH